MKPLYFILSLIAIFIAGKSNAQGGNDCSGAMANAIVLPFNAASQTTCGKGNDYFNINYPCNNNNNSSLYNAGEDYLYYFTAAQSGIVSVKVSNISPVKANPNFLVTQGCPGSAGTSCVAFQTSAGLNNSMEISFFVTQGQSYFITMDNLVSNNSSPSCFNYDINIVLTTLPINPHCTNADFETGDMYGWTALYGKITTSVAGSKTPDFNLVGVGIQPNRHVIQTGGIDPYGNFPMVCPGGSYSLRIGNNINGAQGEQIRQSFIVDSLNPYFTYKYAVVFEDPKHPVEQQPFFKAQMFDKDGVLIPCSEYIVAAAANIPGFQTSAKAPDVYYKTWSTVAIDLKNYVNQAVTMIITNGDCSLGGHFGYAYVDGTCFPTSNLGLNDTICAGNSRKLKAPDGFATYLWQPGGQTTQEIDANATGIYTVTVTSYTGCSLQINDTLFVAPIPKTDFSFVPNNCVDTTVHFSNTSTVAAGGAIQNVAWNFGGDAIPQTSTDSVVNVYFNTPGDHIVTLKTTSIGGCEDSVQKKIYFNPCSFSVRLDGGLVCSNGCISLTPQVFLGTPPFTYSWSPNIGTGAGPLNVCPTADTTIYTVTVTDSLGAVDSDTAIVIKNRKFTLSTSTSDVGCRVNNDGRADVYVNGGIAPYQYSWSNGSTGPADSLLTPGQYSVIVTDALGCTDSAVVIINQKATQLNVKIDKDSVAICYGSSVTLTASGADTYNWSPATGLSNDVGNVVDANPLADIIYQVIGTDTSGCKDTAYTHIFVSAPIQLSFLITKATCQANDGSIITSVTGGKAPFTYAWNSGETTKDVMNMAVGKYFVTVTDSIGCQQSDTVLISNFNKSFPVSINASKVEVCNGDSVLLKVSGGGLKQWFTQGNFITNGDSVKIRPDQTGSFLVLVTDSLGCIDSSTVAIIVNPLPALNLNMADKVICLNQSVTFSVSGADNYTWSSNIGNYHGNSVTVKPDHTDTYTVYGTDGKGCTSDTASALVTVHPLPFIDIGPDTALARGTTYLLNPVYPNNIVQWKWTPDINISCTSCPAPVVTAYRPIRYYLNVTDKNGCTSMDSILLMLSCSAGFIQIPNAFTPNGDGNNDFFRPIIGADIIVKSFRVFNRFGEQMYSIKDFDTKGQLMQGWNGSFKGVLQGQGAYVYMLEVVCESGEHNFYKGAFLLIQ